MLSKCARVFKLSDIETLECDIVLSDTNASKRVFFWAITWFTVFGEIAMNILGIQGGASVIQHDPSAAIPRDCRLLCFIEEERIYRVRSTCGVLPIESISACLCEA